jgi:hypothetical protein
MVDPGKVRQPRAWLNGITLMSCVVYLTRHQSASEFTATMALDDASNPGAAYWSNTAPIPATITATNGDGSGQGTLIIGAVDKVNIDFVHRIVEVHGLDRTSELLNTRSDQKWTDMSPSDIVSQIAGKHGLTPHVDSTSDKAGKTFDFQQYAFNSDIENDWDVLVSLAEREGKVVYIFGNDLYFTTPGSTMGGTYTAHYTPPSKSTFGTGNFMELKCIRDVQIGEGFDAKVTSWHTNKKVPFVGDHTGGEGGGGVQNQFFNRVPGLTPDQTQAQADSLGKMTNSFEKQVELHAPGDVAVNPNMSFVLTGTQTAFDQTYFIDVVTHRINWHEGYTMLIEAKNTDTGV